MDEDLERASMNTVRGCVFHTNSKGASRQAALMHECIGVMLAGCFQFQHGVMTSDANMASYYLLGGIGQGSTSMKGSCWQEFTS